MQQVDYPDGRKTVYADFDDKTNAPKAVTRRDNTESDQSLNDRGQQETASGAGTYAMRTGYDPLTGQRTSLTTYSSGTVDGSGAATTGWGYDPYTGLQTSKTYADNSQDVYTYNDAFQLNSVTRPGITASSFVYNQAGELNQSSLTDSSSGTVTNSVLNRDDRGTPTWSSQTSNGKTAASIAAFDALGRPTYDRSGDGGAGVVYEYFGPSDNGNGAAPNAIKAKTLKDGNTVLQRTEYAYDSVTKRLQTVKVKDGAGTLLADYTYAYKTGTDLVASVTGPGGTTSYTYEPLTGRLSTVTASGAGTDPVFGDSLGYTQNDQRNTETVTRTLPDGSSVTYAAGYTYDAQDQLATVTTTGTGGPTAESDAYDGIGNRTGYAGGMKSNGLNQYADFSYDGRGNLSEDGTFNYTWDALDRLTSATAHDNSVRVEFGYDGSNRRIEKRVYGQIAGEWVTTASQTTRFAYDGDNLVAEFDGNNTLLRSYVWGLTGLLSVTDHTTAGGPSTYDVITDATGSVVALRDADGNVAASYRYDAWGKLLAAEGPATSACNIRFALGYADGETGLQYHLNRYYSPEQHRWISRDPIAEAGGANVYDYVGNDPMNRIDPSGLDSELTLSREWPAESGGQQYLGRAFSLEQGPAEVILASIPANALPAHFNRTAELAPRQRLALLLGGQIGRASDQIAAIDADARNLKRQWMKEDLDAEVAAYGIESRREAANTLKQKWEARKRGVASMTKVRDALTIQFNELGLGSDSFNLFYVRGDEPVSDSGTGLKAAIAAGVKLDWPDPKGLGSTFFDEALLFAPYLGWMQEGMAVAGSEPEI